MKTTDKRKTTGETPLKIERTNAQVLSLIRNDKT